VFVIVIVTCDDGSDGRTGEVFQAVKSGRALRGLETPVAISGRRALSIALEYSIVIVGVC
jgi:hypothetical protein